MEQNQKRFIDAIRSFSASPPSVIVEVGARDCRETVYFAKEFPSARIYAFECNEQTLPLCREAVREFPAITLVEKAASDIDGKITFFPIDTEKTKTPHADGNPGASSLFRASGKYTTEQYVQRETTVDSVRLDSFLNGAGVSKIDALWMDAQGSEKKVLEGLGIRLRDVDFIHTEVEFREIYAGQPLFWELLRFLRERGFSLHSFTSFDRSFGDALFVSRRLYARGLFGSVLLFARRMARAYLSYPLMFIRKIKRRKA
jgi:FkbM family methyltransferase